MKKSASQPTLNFNVKFIDSPISWVFYTLLFLTLRIIFAGFGLSSRLALTLVNWIHGVLTMFFFHFCKGTPFPGQNQQDDLTFWEQIDDAIQFTSARKFLTIFPIVLFLVAADAAEWDLAWFWINLIITAVVVISKLPFMHGVRLFGINS